jgi:DNA-binding SARP family transcriptional activator
MYEPKVAVLDRGSNMTAANDHKLLVCLLGTFQVVKEGKPFTLLQSGKAARLLSFLALREGEHVSRDAVLDAVWPTKDTAQAGQSLNSLVYTVNKSLGDAIGGQTPVVQYNGTYRLNLEAGVELDFLYFENLIRRGYQAAKADEWTMALACYEEAIALYRGDLTPDDDISTIVERERLRLLLLGALERLIWYYDAQSAYETCIEYSLRLLVYDSCREDIHRQIMYCHTRLGRRALALHQYRLCEQILSQQFSATPEPLTTELFQKICNATL